jgi:hypothetical protein
MRHHKMTQPIMINIRQQCGGLLIIQMTQPTSYPTL